MSAAPTWCACISETSAARLKPTTAAPALFSLSPAMATPLPRNNATLPLAAMDIFSNVTILVVDDEPGIREIMAATLANDGFQVDAAGGGAEALAQLAEKHYDLVVCDWMMPAVDGFDVLAEVKRRSPDAVFIFV